MIIITGFVVLTLFSVFFLSILRRGDKVFGVLSRFFTFLHDKRVISHLDTKLAKLEKAKVEYMESANLVSGKTSVMVKAFIWNFLQRACQIAVPMFAFKMDMMSRGLSFYICVAISGIITLFGYIMLKRRKKA